YWAPDPDTVPATTAPVASDDAASASEAGLLLLSPVWQPVAPAPAAAAYPARQRVLLAGAADPDTWARFFPHSAVPQTRPGDSIAAITDTVAALGPFDHIVWVAPDHVPASPCDEVLIEAREQGVLQVFRLVKALLALHYGVRNLRWTLVTVNTQAVLPHDMVN